MASYNYDVRNVLLEILEDKKKQNAILFQLIQNLSAQTIADPSDQHIADQEIADNSEKIAESSDQKMIAYPECVYHIDNHIEVQIPSDGPLPDNQNQLCSDNYDHDTDLGLSEVGEDYPLSTTTTTTITIGSPVSQGQCVLTPNSNESCVDDQCLDSLSLEVQVPEGPESNIIVENLETTKYQDHELLEYIQNNYSGINENKLLSERSSSYLECHDFCSIDDCHHNHTILDAIDISISYTGVPFDNSQLICQKDLVSSTKANKLTSIISENYENCKEEDSAIKPIKMTTTMNNEENSNSIVNKNKLNKEENSNLIVNKDSLLKKNKSKHVV